MVFESAESRVRPDIRQNLRPFLISCRISDIYVAVAVYATRISPSYLSTMILFTVHKGKLIKLQLINFLNRTAMLSKYNLQYMLFRGKRRFLGLFVPNSHLPLGNLRAIYSTQRINNEAPAVHSQDYCRQARTEDLPQGGLS